MGSSYGRGTPAGRTSVAVLFGGTSYEHDVSRMSAEEVLRFLNPDRYDVTAVLISGSGDWTVPGWPGREHARREVIPTTGGLAIIDANANACATVDIDVVFPLLHGRQGEDGAVQGLLEIMHLPYVGSGVLASAICWDKDYTKRLLRSAGLPVAPYVTVPPNSSDLPADEREIIGLPAFVKPARGGSSFGISRIERWSEMAQAVRRARAYDHKVLVEPSIVGRELSCAVLQVQPRAVPWVAPPIEALLGRHLWYDYDAKYLDPECEVREPTDIGQDVIHALQRTSLDAFQALGCAGLARVDFFLAPDGLFLINEVNTMPGFTSQSIFPAAWLNAGLDYSWLLDSLIGCALRTGPR